MPAPKLNLKRIEVECNRPASRGTDNEVISLMLTIVRGPRGRRKLLGEAFTRQVYIPHIHFKVYHDNDPQALFRQFMQQLIHRGYKPLMYRELDKDDHWGAWLECDLSQLDLSSLDRAKDGEMSFEEEPEMSPPYPPSTASPVK